MKARKDPCEHLIKHPKKQAQNPLLAACFTVIGRQSFPSHFAGDNRTTLVYPPPWIKPNSLHILLRNICWHHPGFTPEQLGSNHQVWKRWSCIPAHPAVSSEFSPPSSPGIFLGFFLIDLCFLTPDFHSATGNSNTRGVDTLGQQRPATAKAPLACQVAGFLPEQMDLKLSHNFPDSEQGRKNNNKKKKA